MNRNLRSALKKYVPNTFVSTFVKYSTLYYAIRDFGGRFKRECPICGYTGKFFAFGSPLRYDATCPRCRSKERHRQHFLLVQQHPKWIDAASVLHFSAEPCFVDDYKKRTSRYIRADYYAGSDEVKVDIQKMQFEDGVFDTIICHQILEHIDDDRAALSEIFRVLKPGGVAVLSTQVIETWDSSYEDPSITDERTRELHFNQNDHVRLYGRDVRNIIRDTGFQLSENVAVEPAVSRYSLIRGEVIFIATKPS